MEYDFLEDLKFVSEAMALSDEQLSARLGLSRQSLFKYLKGTAKPSERTLDAFYSFAYKSNLRINQSREAILKENAKGKILFHGSKWGLEKISATGSRENCDFGNGFYLGETYSQAANFISSSDHGSVYAFEFSLDGLVACELRCDLNWLLAVCCFRGTIPIDKAQHLIAPVLEQIQHADYVCAPIANNKMFQIMLNFERGDITTDEALHALSASDLGQQYVLKTEKALAQLKPLKRLFLSSSEKEALIAQSIERSKTVETKLKMAKREFRGQGTYIEDLLQ